MKSEATIYKYINRIRGINPNQFNSDAWEIIHETIFVQPISKSDLEVSVWIKRVQWHNHISMQDLEHQNAYLIMTMLKSKVKMKSSFYKQKKNMEPSR
jgi:hypothetical protein